jgi:hypothetical protein
MVVVPVITLLACEVLYRAIVQYLPFI